MSFVIVRGKSGVLCWRGDRAFVKGVDGAKTYASEAAAKRALPRAAELTNQPVANLRVAPVADAFQAQFVGSKAKKKPSRKAA